MFLGVAEVQDGHLVGDISINFILRTTTTTTTSTTTTKSLEIKSTLLSPPKKPSDSNFSLNILPSRKMATNIALARIVPFAVSVFVIIVFIVLFTILVVVHKKKNSRSTEIINVQNSEAIKKPSIQVEDPIRAEQLRFMRTVFPHIINFPNYDPGLNL